MKPPPAPLIASFLLFTAMLAGWVAWQQGPTGGVLFAGGKKELPPPAKTRHALRQETPQASVNPLADYQARSEKGLTDQQIGWMLEDFRNAGLEFTQGGLHSIMTAADGMKTRAAQQRWYRDTLVDGLRLTRGQETQLTANLEILLETARNEYHVNPAGDENHQGWIGGFVTPSHWLGGKDSPFLPEKLCKLDAGQLEILHRPRPFFNGSKGMFGQTNELLRPVSLPDSLLVPDSAGMIEFPSAFTIFPPVQKPEHLIATNGDFMPLIRAMHPAQLRTLLLLDSGFAMRIRVALQLSAK